MQFPMDMPRKTGDSRWLLLESLLLDNADGVFLDQLDQSRSAYKDIAKGWFQVVLWTGLSAGLWPEISYQGQLEHRLELRAGKGHVSTYSLILFDDEHLEIIRRFCICLAALDKKGVDRSFHQSRQLFTRTSKKLWPEKSTIMNFRTAQELFRHRYLRVFDPKKTRKPWKNGSRSAHVILPNPRILQRKTQLLIE